MSAGTMHACSLKSRIGKASLFSYPYGRTKQFLFTSLTDCTPENILIGNIWMRGREYRDYALPHFQRIIHPETTSTLQSRKQHEILNNPASMPLVSLAAE